MTYKDFIKGARYKSESLTPKIEKEVYTAETDRAEYQIEERTIEYKGSIIKRTSYYINNKIVHGRELFLNKYKEDLKTIILGGNYLELEVPREFLELIPEMGDAQDSLDAILDNTSYLKYLSHIDAQKLRLELEDYGAWDEQELGDHTENIKRFLWVKALDYKERLFEESYS